MFVEGEKVYWKYQTGWAGGETRRADAEVLKVNRVKVKIKVFKKAFGGELIAQIKNVLPESLEKRK